MHGAFIKSGNRTKRGRLLPPAGGPCAHHAATLPLRAGHGKRKAVINLRGLCAALLLGGVTLLAGGCGGQKTTQLMIVSPHDPKIQVEFERGFKQKHPDASIKWFSQQGSSEALRFVESQFAGKDKAQGIGMDLFFGGGPEVFMDLDNAGLLQPLPSNYGVPAVLNGVPLVGKNQDWVGAALSGFGILVNQVIADRDKLPVPQVWSDLEKPKLRNRVELADPRQSGSAHVAYEIILQTEGWQRGWQTLTGMAANASQFINSSSQLTQDVQSGEAAMVPAIDFYARTAVEQAGGGKLIYVAPRGQQVTTPDPIGILRGAPHLELARQFVDFVMSPEGQKLWMYKKGAPGGPVNNSLYRQAALPSLYKPISPDSLVQQDPYSAHNTRPYDSKVATVRRKVLDDLIGAVLIDNQKLIKARLARNPDLAAATFVPITEAQAAQLAAQWSDASFRNAKLNDWGIAARAHFNQ